MFLRLARLPHCLFLDSAMTHPTLGRYSFVAADPFDFLCIPADGRDALRILGERLGLFSSRDCIHEGEETDLPPFRGGAAGLFGYELGRSLERIPAPRFDEFGVPALAVGLYDVVVAFDHVAGRAWILSQGFPETQYSARLRRARQRLDGFRAMLAGDENAFDFFARREKCVVPTRQAGPSAKRLCPDYSTRFPNIASNFSKDAYLAAVRRVIEYIAAGDVFQVNLAQRLLAPQCDDSVALYRRLRRCNPAPFAGYFNLGDFQIASASPERFLRVADRRVETRPIKGTRPRSGDAAADRAAEADLLASEKDRAENVMIVDLLRNDLGRVCEIGSVRVGQLCAVEACRHVLHLVSSVHGRLREGLSAIDLLRAAFPGGSITGAPKIRAMQIIAELEPTARGAYCGSLGYLGFDGAADLNILIRTITAGRGLLQFPVGGGIVADSSPELEYEETWHKAEGLIRALS